MTMRDYITDLKGLVECPVCLGIGSNDHYYNDYDVYETICEVCNGKGEIPVGEING